MAVEQAFPPDWASRTPGPELAALLEGVDLTEVADERIVDVLAACWRQQSHLHALAFAAMVEIGRRYAVDTSLPDPKDRAEQAYQAMGTWHWATHQIAAALTLAKRRADAEYGLAQQLVEELPLVFQALADGRIDRAKAAVFADYLANCTAAQAEVICRRLLRYAPGWTTGQLAHRLLRDVLAIDPGYARRRYQNGVRERGVWGYLDADGTATLTATGLTPGEAAAAAERLERLAAAVRRAGHPNTEVQLRADLFVRLLDGRFEGLTSEQIIRAMLAEACSEPGSGSGSETDAAPGSGCGSEPGPARSGADPNSAGSGVWRGRCRRSRVRPTAGTGEGSGPPFDAGTPAPENIAGTAGRSGAGDRAGSAGPAAPDGTGPAGDKGATRAGPTIGAPPPEGPGLAEDAGPAKGAARAGVEIRVGLNTLLGIDDHPAELPGWGPILSNDARGLVARQHEAEWRFAVLDDDGYLIHGGLLRRRPIRVGRTERCVGGIVEIHVRARWLVRLTTLPDLAARHRDWAGVLAEIARRYAHRDRELAALDGDAGARRPNAGLRRYVQMRDRRCVAPGCRRPAVKAQLDHTHDHARGGESIRANLGPLCELHHLMKHFDGWTLTQPQPGLFRWDSPLGQVYWGRGEPIAPDLPDPLPGPDEPDPGSAARQEGPILPPAAQQRRHPPEPPPDPDPPPDEPPPF